MFNALKYTRQLEELGLSRDQAEVSINLLVEIMHDNLASKQDLLDLRQSTKQDILDLKKDIFSRFENLELKMTVKLGGMLIVAVGLIVTLQKIF